MATGLEVRVPFCDHRLVEYLWNVPWEMKARGGMKGLLKDAMVDIVPATTLERKKSGYPGLQDPAGDAAVIDEALYWTTDVQSPIRGLFDVKKIQEVAADGKPGVNWLNAAHVLIPVVEFGRWIHDYRVSFL